MYKQEKVIIRELFEQKLTDEKSVKALRSRADEHVLVFLELGDDGRSQLFDKQLSSVRAKAARLCKKSNPKITWDVFRRMFDRLDDRKPALNEAIIASLNNGSVEEAMKKILESITSQLRKDRYANIINPLAEQ